MHIIETHSKKVRINYNLIIGPLIEGLRNYLLKHFCFNYLNGIRFIFSEKDKNSVS